MQLRLCAFGMIVLTLSYILTGCGRGTSPRRTQEPNNSPQVSQSGTKILELTNEDFGVNEIKLGDSSEVAKQKLGIPTNVSTLHGVGIPVWTYVEKGLEIVFTYDNGPGRVVRITATSPFTGKTSRGVSIGSTDSDVINAYGSSNVVSGRKSMTFVMQDNKVSKIIIEEAL